MRMPNFHMFKRSIAVRIGRYRVLWQEMTYLRWAMAKSVISHR